MCGIVGYVGNKKAEGILINGLRRLEYRGYDSSGIATVDEKGLHVCKKAGKVAELDKSCGELPGNAGIGHTRWATHGEPTEANAHPHVAGKIAIVHNGIIENHEELREELEGVIYSGQTDSEVLVHLINKKKHAGMSLLEAVQATLNKVVGTFGLAVIDADEPTTVLVARRGSPILVGIAEDETFIASDPSAMVGHTDRVIYLEDDQLAVCKKDNVSIVDLENNAQTIAIETLEHNQATAEKDGFDHFLIKEIFEQPNVINDTLRGRIQKNGDVRLGGIQLADNELRDLDQLIIIGCGTAYFSGILAKYLLERLAGISVAVEFASEFRYREAAFASKNHLAVFMSQSGETADTMASLSEVKRRGIPTMGIVNVVGSSLARAVDGGIYIHAGPEISVASTKAYSAMVSALIMLGLKIAAVRGVSRTILSEVASSLITLPGEIEEVLKLSEDIKKIAIELKDIEHTFYLGRDALFPVALEGALKLMETTYIHAQAYPTGEMKHGPIALIDENFLSVLLLPEDELLYSKSVSNLEEIKARKGKVLSISSRPKPKLSDYHITIPKTSQWVEPLVINVVLQLFAYHMAVARGNDVDQPRNLAKSVTVE
ncbi:glutamine--fructose-6-phosphate transaminase (isomerizing) [Candidatus Saccharibacteria bacterium]|jgi:glucosamine--fructose-6-phosphate aminotransferase (isomerizing)|nr:glutamine--fructose-6-phosphate transaminase (isomerizing) [Candidatus Saccharibacteria bacterium]